MKTLLILRHAKSSWKDVTVSDHDRPLNKRGKRSTKLIGALLEQEDLLPDLILSSTAVRALKTARRVAKEAGYEGEIELRPDLYHAAPDAYLEAVALEGGAHDCVMVIGHNPGLESLVTVTTGQFRRFPTAALAQVEYEVETWPEILGARGRLVNLWLPRELE